VSLPPPTPLLLLLNPIVVAKQFLSGCPAKICGVLKIKGKQP
jgi:hypothetical protein